MATKARSVMTADELGDLLVKVIQGVAGGTAANWRRAVGKIQRVETWRFVAFNWLVTPTGSRSERETVDKAVAIVRAEHPYIA